MFFNKKNKKNYFQKLFNKIDIPIIIFTSHSPFSILNYNLSLERIFPPSYDIKQNFLLNNQKFLYYLEKVKKEKEIKFFLNLISYNNEEKKETPTLIHLIYEKEDSLITAFLYNIEYNEHYLYEILANNLPIGIAIHQNQKIVYVNSYALQLLNVKDIEEIHGKDIFEFVDENFREIIKKRIENIYTKDQDAPALQEVFLTKDKKPIHVEVRAKKIIWNKEPAILVIFENITKEITKKNFSEKLIKFLEKVLIEEDIHKNIKNLLNIYNTILKANLVCLWFSETIDIDKLKEKIINQELNIYIEMTSENDVHKIYAKDLLLVENSPIFNCLLTKKPIFIKNLIQEIKNSKLQEILLNNKIISYWCLPILNREGNCNGILICHFDIMHDLKDFSVEYLYQATFLSSLILEKEKIEKENSLLSQISRETYDGLILLDTNFKIIWYNNKILQFFPEIESKIKINKLIFYFFESILSKENYETLFKKVFQKEPFSTEIKIENKSNNPMYFEVVFNHLKDSKNILVGYYIIFHDITKEIEYEQKLIEAKTTAEEIAKAKSQFLSIMSHEIRTPLNVIVGIVEYLLKNNPDKNIYDDLILLKTSSEHLLNIVNDILDYSKIEAKKFKLQFKTFSLKEFIKKIIFMVKSQSIQKDLIFESNLDLDLPEYVIGDELRLNQVLINILSNALKFTEKGKIEMNVTLQERKNNKVLILFQIKDTGIGIPQNLLNYIFEPFTQIDVNPSRKAYGTGLGLTITKKIIEMLEGEITIESKVNQGTTINIFIPFSIPEEEHFLKGSNLIKEDFPNVKLLIVDDYLPNLLITKKFLELWKIQSDLATSGEEAIHKLKTNNYTLILLDLHMPGMDGYTTAKKIREFNKQIPIIAITASTIEEFKNRIENSEINDLIIKPFNPEMLIQKIKNFINT